MARNGTALAQEPASASGQGATAFRPLAAGLAALLLILSAATGYAQVSPTGNQAVLQFQRAADDYAFLHRRLERRLGPLEVTAGSETVRIAMNAMAASIRAARPDARQGDLFTPAVQDVIRARVSAMEAHARTSDAGAPEIVEGIDVPEVALKVNGPFPWVVGTALLPRVLDSLPALPPELEYRLVGRDLVLIDSHANLIVDILPFAIATAVP